MKYEHIDDARRLGEFCETIRDATWLAFDTEFVSEDSFRPQLCLIQVAAPERLAIIDPLAIDDLTPFWQLLATPGHETIVHAGREEFRFCFQALGQGPVGWFDVQIAAGFIGLEYPAAYSTLISKLLGKSLPKGETRTDWRRRPLSKRQLEYALLDVTHLKGLRDVLVQRLDVMQRRDWLVEELTTWQQHLMEQEKTEQWRRVSGSSGMSARQLTIVRELWRWRNAEAERRNCPAKRVLRDDLIVELARRGSDDAHQIQAVRGMNHRHLTKQVAAIADCVRKALAVPSDECPRPARRGDQVQPPLVLLGQFLSAALGCICRDAELAPSLVGSVQDVRDLVAYRLGLSSTNDELPALASGWRAAVVGQKIERLLSGQIALRVADPLADQPLCLQELSPECGPAPPS